MFVISCVRISKGNDSYSGKQGSGSEGTDY